MGSWSAFLPWLIVKVRGFQLASPMSCSQVFRFALSKKIHRLAERESIQSWMDFEQFVWRCVRCRHCVVAKLALAVCVLELKNDSVTERAVP